MADARVEHRTEKKKVEIEVTVPEVALRLTPEEAVALRLVLGRHAGLPDNTARGLLDNVINALDRAAPQIQRARGIPGTQEWEEYRHCFEGEIIATPHSLPYVKKVASLIK